MTATKKTTTDTLNLIAQHTEAIRALLPDIEIQPDHCGIYGFAKELFARFGMVIIETCSLEDVQEVRPDLTDEQAFDVLQQIDHDVTAYCDRTVSNSVIEDAAAGLFPRDDDDEDGDDDDTTALVTHWLDKPEQETELVALASSFGGAKCETEPSPSSFPCPLTLFLNP